MVWFDFCFMALQHILGHFRNSQLPLPHCSWASLLGSFPVLNAHILPVTDICSSWISRRGRMAVESFLWPSLQEKNAPDVGIKLEEASMPSSHATAACLFCVMVLLLSRCLIKAYCHCQGISCNCHDAPIVMMFYQGISRHCPGIYYICHDAPVGMMFYQGISLLIIKESLVTVMMLLLLWCFIKTYHMTLSRNIL